MMANPLNALMFMQKYGKYMQLAFMFLVLASFVGSLVPAGTVVGTCTPPGATTPSCTSLGAGDTASCVGVQIQASSLPGGVLTCPIVQTSSCTGTGFTCVPVVYPICSIYNTIHTAIFILGLALLILGAALYAGANIAPGNLKGQIQGYGLGMITGGIVGVIIAVIAPYLLTMISGQSGTAAICSLASAS